MLLAATWMDLQIIILTKVSQTKERQVFYDIAYMWNLKKKMIQINLFIKQKQTYRLTDLEKETMVTRGERVEGMDTLGVWY